MKKAIWVIGLGVGEVGALPAYAQEMIAQAQVLIGGRRLLAGVESPAEKLVIGANLGEIVARIQAREADEQVVVLASGDPGFHGIAGTLLRYLSPEEVEIIPNVSALQAAFARVKEPWSDAVLVSAHAHDLAEIVGWAKRCARLGVLTDHKNTPAVIAQHLLQAGVRDCRAVVAENLGQAEEELTETRLSALAGKTFGALNVLLVLQEPEWHPVAPFAPRPESAYVHQRGLITKADIRALSLARLALSAGDVVWDIGAGSGAVSIEMAELAWQGQVFAIERNEKNLDCIRQNIARYGSLNVLPVAGKAPEILAGLPEPDAVFIGGTGGQLAAVFAHLHTAARPGCRVVINLVTLENLNEAMTLCREYGWLFEVTQASIAHSQNIAQFIRLVPENPVFILSFTII